jgi:hypothetical protein
MKKKIQNTYIGNRGEKKERSVCAATAYVPDFRVGGDVADELHRADADGHAGRREERVHLRPQTNNSSGR